MSSTPQGSPRHLPEHPDLRHLKDQAKDLLRSARRRRWPRHSFQWPAVRLCELAQLLKAHVESLQAVGQLKAGHRHQRSWRVKQLMTAAPGARIALRSVTERVGR